MKGDRGMDGVDVEALLGAALREDAGPGGCVGERRALDAFRGARDLGAHRARTRRRDDWRPRERWSAGRSLKATLALFLAGLTLGGVAYAGIGAVRPAPDGGEAGRERVQPSAGPDPSAARRPSGSPSAPDGQASPGRPATAGDTLAHCRAYESVDGRGKALDATAWQRLISAAGGERKVGAYCARQLARAEGRKATPGSGRGNSGEDNSGQAENQGNGNQSDKPSKGATRSAGKPEK